MNSDTRRPVSVSYCCRNKSHGVGGLKRCTFITSQFWNREVGDPGDEGSAAHSPQRLSGRSASFLSSWSCLSGSPSHQPCGILHQCSPHLHVCGQVSLLEGHLWPLLGPTQIIQDNLATSKPFTISHLQSPCCHLRYIHRLQGWEHRHL